MTIIGALPWTVAFGLSLSRIAAIGYGQGTAYPVPRVSPASDLTGVSRHLSRLGGPSRWPGAGDRGLRPPLLLAAR